MGVVEQGTARIGDGPSTANGEESMKRRSLVAAATLAVLCATGHAQASAHRYVAVSLVGDELNYVGATDATGSLHPRGAVQAVPMKGAPFDRTVLEVLAGDVPKMQPKATLSFLQMSAPEAFAHQDDWFDGGKLVPPAALRGAVEKEGATELLLVTKYRGEAAVTDGTTKWGVGKLTGLGFYIDRNTDMSDPEVGHVNGFIAPYVYIRLSVVDVATWSVKAHRIVQSARPYTSLKPQQMMDVLQQSLIDGLDDAVQRTLVAD
jgi:hypothetical protein